MSNEQNAPAGGTSAGKTESQPKDWLRVLTGIEIRVFLVIDALSRFSGMAFACSADLPLLLAKQLLDSTAIGVACGGGRTGVDVTVDSWRGFRNPPLTPRIPRFLIPANSEAISPPIRV